MKKRYLLCLLLGLLFWGYSESCSLKEEGEKNRYILSNRFLTVEINADKGGGIENISYSPKDISLTDTSADMISFEDRIYSQSQKESGKAVDVEYFAKYPYTARVLKNTEREVSVEVSATALSEAFPGLTVRKIYSLKEDACALFVEHILENTSDSAVEAGIWSTNFFRIMGGLGERNIFYTPAEDGLRAVLHPGKDVKAGGNWTLYPSENWKGLTGELSKDGLVVIFEYRHLSCFYDWSSEKSKVSTFEWMIKEQRIEPKKSFSTKYVIMPVSECDRIDSVIGNRVACGIEYQPGKVKLGDDVDVRYCLSGYEKQKVTVKAKIESEGRIVKEFLREEIVLEAGKTHSDSLSFRIEKEGVYRAEIEVLEGNKVIGQAERQIFAGNFTVDAKPETGAGKKPEELFWMGMKTAGLSEWQDVKISQYRINPAMMKKDSEKNMVALGDFEETDEKKYAEQKWTIGLGKGAVLTDESAHGGRYSLKMQVPAGAKSPVFEIGTPLCKVEAGREYRVTFWAKASNAGGGKYVLFPSYYFYKGSMEKPEYTGRLFQMIQTPDFDWKEIERIIVIPEGVEWLRFFAATRATKGDIYIDDVKIVPVALSDKQERKERAFHFYKDLDIYFNVSEEYVTPHVRWLKPYTEGKIKVLYLAYMDRLDSTNKRDVVELNQRMDMDYKFIPLINRKTGERRSFTKEVEPYILDVVNEELEKDWEVVVVNNLDFKGVQDQLAIDLLEAVKRGKGLVLTGCKNLPEDMNKALTGADKIKIPANFYCIPEVNKTLRQEKQIPQIVSIRQVGKGRIAIINEKKGLYPCIPADKTGELSPNNYGREIPYWEYRMFPVIKSAVFTSGRESEARINSIACSGNLLEAKIESGTEVNGYMEVSFNDVYGQAEKREKYPVKLTAGSNELQFSLPVLPGGDHIADCKLTDSKSRIYDFWSFSFSVPFISKVTGISFARPYYSKTEEIKAHVKFENVTEGTLLSWYVEDTYERVIRKGRAELKAGDLKSDINFMIDNPLTILYRLFVSLEKENKTLSTKMEEFSMPFNLPADDELVGYGWFAHQGAHAYRAWKENGFGSLVNSTYWTGTAGVFKQLCNVNMRPCLYGQLYSAGNPDPGDKFRGDRATPEDSVRKPCFSDPDWWSKIKEESVKRMKDNKMVYYGIKDHSLGDECFLGADVCFSEWCLKDFREYLKKQYRDLKALNKVWQTDYKNWEEVMPLERKDVKEENLSRWLDHKMFMSTVFAKIQERMKNINEEINPDVKIRIGSSGTQNPGFSYNWWELMKYMECIQYYGGIQGDLIRSFRKPGTRYGQWVGYAPAYTDSENYSRYYVWRVLFNHANSYMLYYSGYALLGDLVFARNTRYVLEELKKVNRGIDKILLSSDMVCDIGLHYSQSSLFASMATVGKSYWSGALDSWNGLIGDLGLNFEFVSYEQLETRKLDKNRYRVFVLPVSLCLSDKEIETLREYVETGGTLIADYGAGIYDGHGKKADNKRLLEVFGIKREGNSKISFIGESIKVTGDKGEGLQERELKLRCGETGLKLTTGKAYGNSGEAGAPAVIINRFGKGRAVLLNCVMSDYAQVTMTGGGELSEVKSGKKEINEQVRGLLRDILRGEEVEPYVLVRTGKGEDFQPAVKTSVWKNGETYYIGLLNRPEEMYSGIKPADATSVSILFRKGGHVYDVTEGKYLGYLSGNKEVKTTIFPSMGKIYAVLPYKVEQINANADARSYVSGDKIKVSVNLKTSGKQAGNHVIYAEVAGPDGRIIDYYTRKVHIRKGEGIVEIPTALNDTAGTWKMTLKDVASGLSRKIDIKVLP